MTLAIGAGAALAPAAQAADFVVTSLGDGPANACDADCTLRDAITAANNVGTADTITFASGLSGTIELAAGQDQLEVYGETNIQGPGASAITVDANALSRAFYVRTEPASARISGLTITGGADVDYGGGIYFVDGMPTDSTLTVDDVTFTRNTATDAGGAIDTSLGNLVVSNSRFVENTSGDSGGAITGSPQLLDISRSTFSGNRAADDGGAIRVSASTRDLRIADSTFDGNFGHDGGALLLFGPSVSGTIRNSTFVGNTSETAGGAIRNTNARDVTTQLQNSTVTGNTAPSGGGIYRQAYDDPQGGDDNMIVTSSIVAGNIGGANPDLFQRTATPPAINGAFLIGNSLIGLTGGTPFTETAPNLIGADPHLGPLADNGGPTLTQLPAPASPVIDAGTANGLATDQRGQPRVVGAGTDIGAVELGVVDGATVKAKRKQKVKGKKVQIKVRVGAGEAASANVGGTITINKQKLDLKPVTTELSAGSPVTVRLKPVRKVGSKLVIKALRSGKKVKAKVDVTITDAFKATLSKRTNVKLR